MKGKEKMATKKNEVEVLNKTAVSSMKLSVNIYSQFGDKLQTLVDKKTVGYIAMFDSLEGTDLLNQWKKAKLLRTIANNFLAYNTTKDHTATLKEFASHYHGSYIQLTQLYNAGAYVLDKTVDGKTIYSPPVDINGVPFNMTCFLRIAQYKDEIANGTLTADMTLSQLKEWIKTKNSIVEVPETGDMKDIIDENPDGIKLDVINKGTEAPESIDLSIMVNGKLVEITEEQLASIREILGV